MRKAWPILVVDDQPAFLEMLVDFLSHEGFAAIGASNGEDAIRQIEHNHFAVLIVDLKMTPIGGEQVIEVAKKQSNLTEIIVITGFPSLSSTVEAIRYQVFDYVTKPVDLERLLRMVENACEQYQLRRANEQILDQLNRQHEILQSRIKEVSEELEQLSTTDALTGLFNYRFFTEVIQTEISRASGMSAP
jgi:DNA-binding NtrC family response regulator